jgi:hypothetical protein
MYGSTFQTAHVRLTAESRLSCAAHSLGYSPNLLNSMQLYHFLSNVLILVSYTKLLCSEHYKSSTLYQPGASNHSSASPYRIRA